LIKVKDCSTGEILNWTLDEVLYEINRDHNNEWVDYDETDWREGWDDFVEGNGYYSLKIKQFTLSRSYTVTEEIVIESENYADALSLCKGEEVWDNPDIRESEYQHHKIIGVKQ